MMRILVLALLLALTSPAVAGNGASLTVTPDIIRHEVLHRPARITATANVPPGTRAVFRVVGPLQTLELFSIGRVGGVLWSSTGRRVHVGVPAVYLIGGWPRAPRDEDLVAHGLVAVVHLRPGAMRRAIIAGAHQALGVLLLPRGDQGRVTGVVPVVHALGPEDLDVVVPAPVDHHLQRVSALVNQRIGDVVLVAAIGAGEDLRDFGAVGMTGE